MSSKQSKKLFLYKRQPYCHYCEAEVGPLFLTIEHIIPKSRKGSSHIDNLTLSCEPCNVTKSSELYENFKKKYHTIHYEMIYLYGLKKLNNFIPPPSFVYDF